MPSTGCLIRYQKNRICRIELVAAMLVIMAMVILGVQRWEAVALTFTIFGVLVLEMINTLVERLVNVFSAEDPSLYQGDQGHHGRSSLFGFPGSCAYRLFDLLAISVQITSV